MTWPNAAEFTALVLTVPCFRCGALTGKPCRTDPGRQEKRNPYTGELAFHQRRLDLVWRTYTGSFHLPPELLAPNSAIIEKAATL